MNRSKQFNGERLKAARTYRGLTVAELAEKMGLKRQTVSMYENDKLKNPEYSTIKNMGNILNFPVDFFLEVNSAKIENGSTYFRSLLTTNKKYRNQQIQKLEFVSLVHSFLSEYIEFPGLNLPETQEEWTPDIAATALRQCWKLGERPIENIIYLAEQNGVLVTRFDTETADIDAFSHKVQVDGSSLFVIGYSKNKGTAARIHFDIAHEIGHMLLHDWSEDIESLTKDEFKERENQAHAFASAFLLPAAPFIADVGAYANSLFHYRELKKKWKASMSAMIRRSYNLGLLDYGSYQQLMRTMQKQGIKKEEPLDDTLITATPSILKASVQMLLEEGVLTPKEFMYELAENYNISIEHGEIEALLDLPKDTLKISNVIPMHKLRVKNGGSDARNAQ